MFTFTLPHKLGQAAAVALLKANADEPGWRTGTTHQEWDEPIHTAKVRMVTHLHLPFVGHVKDVETELTIVVNERFVTGSGSCEPAWAERFVEPAVKHKLAEVLG